MQTASLRMNLIFCCGFICAYGVDIDSPEKGSLRLNPSVVLHQAARTGIATFFLTFFSTMPSRTASGVGVSRIVL